MTRRGVSTELIHQGEDRPPRADPVNVPIYETTTFLFESADEIFFKAPVHFPDFEAFERQIIGVTHTRHVLSDAVYAEVRQRFMAHVGADGARFESPMRVNLLRKPGAA